LEGGRSDLDSETKAKLEQKLGQAEAGVLRLRAELGYSLSNHLTGTSTRLEKIARVRDRKELIKRLGSHIMCLHVGNDGFKETVRRPDASIRARRG
jgi:hypothetical protein